MPKILLYILITTFLISLLSFIGVFTLAFKEKVLNKLLLFLVAFSAGALMGATFFDLIPESIMKINNINEIEIIKLFIYLIFGFCSFFILEQFISWHHHHVIQHEECPGIKPFSYLVLISDALHNFLDGVIIAAAFVTAVPIGIATTLAVAFHEIPHEIGNFGILVYGGFQKYHALWLNFLSAIFAVVGGIGGYFLSESINNFSTYLLSFAAGNFIYIAASDLIPEIKKHNDKKKSFLHFIIFIVGLIFMLLVSLKLESSQ